MIFRRIAHAFRKQDWFVVFIEIVIVVIGVYIGIYLGDIQEAQKFKHETDTALVALESELRADLVRLDEVIDIQTNMVATQQRLINLLSTEPYDTDQIGDLLVKVINDNSTFFPNRSAYQAMESGGFLAALPDEKLRLHLTRLFEREYDRQDANATWYDDLGFKFAMEHISNNWDRDKKRFMPGAPNAPIILQNGLWPVHEQGAFYLGFIAGTVRPGIVEALDMIDAYQGEEAKQ